MTCLRRLVWLFAAFSLICCVACDPCPLTSINPFYTEEDRIYEPGLVGEWVFNDLDNHMFLKVEEQKPDPPTDPQAKTQPEATHWYKATISEKGYMSVWHAYLFKLGDALFLDVSPDESEISHNVLREYHSYSVRVHGLFRVKIDGDELHLAEVMDRAISGTTANNDKTTASDGSTVLFQPTTELQSIIKEAGTSKEVYASEKLFTRSNTKAYYATLAELGDLGLCSNFYENRRWDDALSYCKQAVDLRPSDNLASLLYATVLAGTGHGSEGRTLLASAMDQCRRMPGTGFWSGLCADFFGNDMEKYETKITSSQHMLFGMSYFADKQWAEAAQEFSQAKSTDVDMQLRFAWALSLQKTGKVQQALELLRDVPKPNNENVQEPPKPTQDELMSPLLVDYVAGKLSDSTLESKWDVQTMGSGRDYYVACMRYAKNDFNGAAEIFKRLARADQEDNWPFFLATVRLRQIEAEQQKPMLKKASKRTTH